MCLSGCVISSLPHFAHNYKSLLACGVRDDRGQTALHLAASAGNREMMQASGLQRALQDIEFRLPPPCCYVGVGIADVSYENLRIHMSCTPCVGHVWACRVVLVGVYVCASIVEVCDIVFKQQFFVGSSRSILGFAAPFP
jgi:hypothetical protein